MLLIRVGESSGEIGNANGVDLILVGRQVKPPHPVLIGPQLHLLDAVALVKPHPPALPSQVVAVDRFPLPGVANHV